MKTFKTIEEGDIFLYAKTNPSGGNNLFLDKVRMEVGDKIIFQDKTGAKWNVDLIRNGEVKAIRQDWSNSMLFNRLIKEGCLVKGILFDELDKLL